MSFRVEIVQDGVECVEQREEFAPPSARAIQHLRSDSDGIKARCPTQAVSLRKSTPFGKLTDRCGSDQSRSRPFKGVAMPYEGTPARDFLATELVTDHIEKATAFVSAESARMFGLMSHGYLTAMSSVRMDSPLEVVFWVWWTALAQVDQGYHDMFTCHPQREVVIAGQTYRVDFLMDPIDPRISADKRWRPIAVELDGHAFHEKTKEQVALRNSRDRALQQADWKVFHFSFSEMTNNPFACASEVMVYARNQWNTVSMELAVERYDARHGLGLGE